MADADINVLAVIVATVVAMAIGFAWFTVFAQPWMAAVGRTREEMQGGANSWMYAVTALLWLMSAVVLAYVVDWAQADTFAEGLLVGLMVWVGFVLARKGTASLFEQRSRNLFFLDVGHDLVALVVMSVILALWN